MIAIDQYGSTFPIRKHPRKELLNQLYRKHASKMYVDDKNGKALHIGYVIAGHWLTVYDRKVLS